MSQIMLFLGFSFLAMLTLILIAHKNKKADFRSIIGLFIFGIVISIPFVMVEFLRNHLKFYLMILTFVGIELLILITEKKVKYFHELVHHNIKELRITSFLLIGLGFTYSEIAFTIFNHHGAISNLISILPIKTAYALLMHTIFASAASLIRVGNLFAETIYETVFKLVGYYLRISLIGVSHFIYSFSLEHNFLYLVCAGLIFGVFSFFILKRNLDEKIGIKSKN